MAREQPIQTATMARIYAQQGHYLKAAAIYRHLLSLDPSRQDIAEALAELEAKQNAETHTGKKDLAPLLREWVRLSVRYNQVQRLQRLKENLSSTKADVKSDT